MKHTLKISPLYFDLIKECEKNFKIVFDDRNFSKGDELTLEEQKRVGSTGYESTGKYVERKIEYILRNCKGLQRGYVVLGFESTT